MATFILVHGTYAKSAHWPNLQDALTEAAHAAGDEPVFEQLAWTGRNRARDRQAAASAIHTLVQGIRRGSANEKIFIIGHSHGGSAIAYFLKEYPEAAKTLGGCAFLSTPFVAIRPRREAFRFISLLIFFPYIAFLSLLNEITNPRHNVSTIEEYLNTPIITSAHLFSVFVACVVGALLWLALIFIKRASAPQKVEQSIRQQTADIPAGNYLFLRCSGDEAAAALSAAQIIAWGAMKTSRMLELLTRPLFSPGRTFARVVSWVLLTSLLLPSFAYAWFFVLPGISKFGFRYFLWPDGLFRSNELVLLMGYMAESLLKLISFVAACLLLLCVLAALLIFLTQAVTSWLFGWTRLSTGFLVELAIEPLPFGEHSLVHIDWTAGSIGLDGMAHSWTHDHPVAIMHLQNWVRESLGKSPMTAAERMTVRP
jgi:pimeloyl-ACP methyl ester carboxylesterase